MELRARLGRIRLPGLRFRVFGPARLGWSDPVGERIGGRPAAIQPGFIRRRWPGLERFGTERVPRIARGDDRLAGAFDQCREWQLWCRGLDRDYIVARQLGPSSPGASAAFERGRIGRRPAAPRGCPRPRRSRVGEPWDSRGGRLRASALAGGSGDRRRTGRCSPSSSSCCSPWSCSRD